MSRPVHMVLIGAGNRGRGIFGKFALDNPHRAKFIAVVEPEEVRRTSFAHSHGIEPGMQFASIDEFFERHPERMADALIIATIEKVRVDPIRRGMGAGYAILCEKPLGLSAAETLAVTDAAREHSGLFMVCHQMRYAPLYRLLKRLVASGKYGRVINVEHSENLDFEHMAHSYVRGFFNNDALTPMILAKSCHDMDLLLYLIGRKPSRIASFGSLTHFRAQNAPAGAPDYCLKGCPVERECPYYAGRIYFRPDTDEAYLRQMGVIRDRAHLFTLLQSNRFGRCVYKCDNNVVDHQVCAIEFEEGVTASFTMAGHNGVERRRTRIQLTDAELELDTSRRAIEIRQFSTGVHEILKPPSGGGTHAGGDSSIMNNLVDAIATGCRDRILTSVSEALDSHLLAFAAEASRKSGKFVSLAKFEADLRRSARNERAVETGRANLPAPVD